MIRESFTLTGSSKEGVIEQIDGVVEIDGKIYLVEMKWWDKTLGPGEVSPHLVRLFSRDQAHGIIISNSDFTPAAIETCREALRQKVVVLCKLEEIVFLLEKETNVTQFFKEKVRAAVVHKNPFYEPLKDIN